MISLKPFNAAWASVSANNSTIQKLRTELSFDSPGAQFSPAYKRGKWDGKIYLLKEWDDEYFVPAGLHDKIETWAKTGQIPCSNGVRATNPIDTKEIDALLAELDLEARIGVKPYDYQLRAFLLGLQNRKGVYLSPTASGKSLIFWLWAQYHIRHSDTPLLIIVPTLGLKKQLTSDFLNYGSKKSEIQTIDSTDAPKVVAPIVIANWQSIYKNHQRWFEPFGMVLGDEVHLYQSKSITEIMTKLINTEYRLGLTGTLEDAKCHRLVIEGHFGPIRSVAKTANLQERGILSQIDIQQLFLLYSDADRHELYEKKRKIEDELRKHRKAKPDPFDKNAKKKKAGTVDTFQTEVEFTNYHAKRLALVARLAVKQPKHENTLVLFNYKERHGIPLHEAIVALAGDTRPIYYVDGDVDADERDAIRQYTEEQQGVIIVASYGVFSTGINIRNLHRIIFAGASKSKYRVLQGIGRGLRLHKTKDKLIVFDLVDDLRLHDNDNYLYKHAMRRRKFYAAEHFPVTDRHIMLDTA